MLRRRPKRLVFISCLSDNGGVIIGERPGIPRHITPLVVEFVSRFELSRQVTSAVIGYTQPIRFGGDECRYQDLPGNVDPLDVTQN